MNTYLNPVALTRPRFTACTASLAVVMLLMCVPQAWGQASAED